MFGRRVESVRRLVSQLPGDQVDVALTLPRKLDMVHKKTTHRRRINPSVCLASPPDRVVVGRACSGASSSLCREESSLGLLLPLLLLSSISGRACGGKDDCRVRG